MEAYAGLNAIYHHMSIEFDEGKLRGLPQQWDFDNLTIEATNKWMIQRRQAPTAQTFSFTLAEDPYRVLNTAASGAFVRTANHAVEYMVIKGFDDKGNPKYVSHLILLVAISTDQNPQI